MYDIVPSSRELPVTRDLTVAYASSLLIAAIMAVAAAAGLVSRSLVYPTRELLLFTLPTDMLSLALGLPLLLGSMWLARRGELIGLLCWPGALLYVLYIYLVYVISVPFGPLFLPHVLLVSLSSYTLIGLAAAIDAEIVRRRLVTRVPARLAGAILAVLALLFLGVQIADIAAALSEGVAMDPLELSPFVADLLVAGPAWLLGGLLLWRREALGYVLGTGLLLLSTMLFFGLGFVLVYPALGAEPVDWAGVAIVVSMGAVCTMPLALFVRGALTERRLARA